MITKTLGITISDKITDSRELIKELSNESVAFNKSNLATASIQLSKLIPSGSTKSTREVVFNDKLIGDFSSISNTRILNKIFKRYDKEYRYQREPIILLLLEE